MKELKLNNNIIDKFSGFDLKLGYKYITRSGKIVTLSKFTDHKVESEKRFLQNTVTGFVYDPKEVDGNTVFGNEEDIKELQHPCDIIGFSD